MAEIVHGIVYILLYLLAIIMLGTTGLGLISLFVSSSFPSLGERETKIVGLKLVSVPFLFVAIGNVINPTWDSSIILNAQRLIVLALLMITAWPETEWPLSHADKRSSRY